jgi:tRNA G18 (ribose-2'-O)-methylase SpoU
VPLYRFPTAADLRLPQGCELVGVEITDDAIDLPSFKHPPRAAYVFGSERMSLSSAVLARCAFTVRIPTRFSINVGMAGAIVMYDRLIAEARFPARPVRPGAPAELPPLHSWGPPVIRTQAH